MKDEGDVPSRGTQLLRSDRLRETSNQRRNWSRVRQIHALQSKDGVKGRSIALNSQDGQALVTTKWTRKSTIKGTVVLTGATPLPRHQPQKSIHFAWYYREVDVQTQPDISTAYPREKPDFQGRRWRVATSECSARRRRCGTC